MRFDLPALFKTAVEFLRDKNLVPTSLSSAALRLLEGRIKRRAVFAARLTQVKVLEVIKQSLDGMLSGEMNLADGKLAMQQSLEAMGYTPEGGFPQDAEGTVPPAVAGTLRDLKSEARMELVLRTQYRIAANEAYVASGTASAAALFQFPAWELVRIAGRRVPRGKKATKEGLVEDPGQDWPSRWVAAGGELIEGRMVARKDSGVWQALGDGVGGFEDTLGNPFPPFAYGSGYGIRQIKREEALLLGVIVEEDVVAVEPKAAGLGEEVALREVSDETLDLWRAEKLRRARGGKKLTVAERLAALGVPAAEKIKLTSVANAALQGRCKAILEVLANNEFEETQRRIPAGQEGAGRWTKDGGDESKQAVDEPSAFKPKAPLELRAAAEQFKNRGVDVVSGGADAEALRKSQEAIGMNPDHVIAAFVPDAETGGKIVINPRSVGWKKAMPKGAFSSDDEWHYLHHEEGHARAWANNQQLVGVAQRYQFSDAEKVHIAEKVSRYATVNGAEFVAEVYAGRVAGKVYPDDILTVYRGLGGVDEIGEAFRYNPSDDV
jgi:hypothetical protein